MHGTKAAIAMSAIIFLALASPLRADVRFEPTAGYLPSGYESATSFFDASAPGLSAAGSIIEVGRTRPCPINAGPTMISTIGPMIGSKLVRSQPVLTDMEWPVAAAYVDAAAEPTVILANSAIEVYAGSPLALRSRIDFAPFARAIAVTRYVDANDFDIAAVDYTTSIVRVRNGTATVLWTVGLPAANSVAVIPASGPVPELVVAVNDGFTVVYDLDGNVVFSTQSGGQEVVAGTIGAASTPVFVVRNGPNGLTAYAANPATPLWQRPDLGAVAIFIGDVSLDGINEVMTATSRGVLQRLNPDGTNYGSPVTLPGASGAPDYSMRLIQSHVAGLSVPQIIVVAETDYLPNDAAATYVFTPNLLTALDIEPPQNGVCNAVHVADVDGDGHDEIVTLGELPGYAGTGMGQPSTVRIAEADDGSEQWIGTLPGVPAVDSYVDFDVGNVGQGIDRDIVLTGYSGTGGLPVVTILNGATHEIALRATLVLSGANLVTGVRIVPGAAPYSILIDANDYNIRSLHLLHAANLQEFWSSGPITHAQPAYQSDLEIAQFAGDPHPHAILPAPLGGVYAWDLATGTQDYSIPGSAMMGVVLPPSNGVTRYAYFDTAEPSQFAVKIIDAATGAALDELAPVPEIQKMAADPFDPQRLVVQDADFVYALRLDEHRVEARSARVTMPPLTGRSLVVRVRDGVETVYAGTSMGVSAFRLLPVEPSIFRNGFDPF